MSNEEKAVPENFLEIDGKKYNFVYSWGVLRRFQQLTGLNPFSPRVTGQLSPVLIHGLVWAVMVKEKPGLTVDQVDELLDPSNPEQLAKIGEVIKKMMTQARIEPSDVKKN